MRKKDIQPGVDVYYAEGPNWRSGPPTKATIVDPGPYRIERPRCGAFYIRSWHKDPTGNAVLVDLHKSTSKRRTAVYARNLRGLWKPTLAATGRTEAGVKAQEARLHELATSGRPITGEDLLRVAACDEGLDDPAFGVLTNAINDSAKDE